MVSQKAEILDLKAALRGAERECTELERRVATLEAALERLASTEGFVGAVSGCQQHILWAELATRGEFARAALDPAPSQSAQPNEEEQAADSGEALTPNQETEQSASQQ